MYKAGLEGSGDEGEAEGESREGVPATLETEVDTTPLPPPAARSASCVPLLQNAAAASFVAEGEGAWTLQPARSASCRLWCTLGIISSCNRSTISPEHSAACCTERRGRGRDAAEVSPARET